MEAVSSTKDSAALRMTEPVFIPAAAVLVWQKHLEQLPRRLRMAAALGQAHWRRRQTHSGGRVGLRMRGRHPQLTGLPSLFAIEVSPALKTALQFGSPVLQSRPDDCEHNAW